MSAEARPPKRIVLFDSIHYVLAAEAVFKERDVWCDLVPVPKELSSDCGMAVEFREEDGERACKVLKDRRVKWRKMYRPVESGFEEVKLE